MGFSISSPDLESLAKRMSVADPLAAYHRAAADAGAAFEGDVAAAFREAGASDGLIDDIGTYIHESGAAYVGVPGGSRHIDDAHELEYGTPFEPPSAALRNTAAARAEEISQQFATAFDRELGAELGGAL